MSDLILSLPHYHRHIAIYVVQIIDTILGRMCLLRDLFGANIYMCYDYVHLDNLSDISAYRNHNVQQCKMQIP